MHKNLKEPHQMEGMMERQTAERPEMEQEHMTDEDVLRYLYLVERRLELLDAGVDWKTEYEAELEAVNQELKGLRGLVEREHERRTKMRPEIID